MPKKKQLNNQGPKSGTAKTPAKSPARELAKSGAKTTAKSAAKTPGKSPAAAATKSTAKTPAKSAAAAAPKSTAKTAASASSSMRWAAFVAGADGQQWACSFGFPTLAEAQLNALMTYVGKVVTPSKPLVTLHVAGPKWGAVVRVWFNEQWVYGMAAGGGNKRQAENAAISRARKHLPKEVGYGSFKTLTTWQS